MDFYKVLNISRTASLLEIKAAYRGLVLLLHPDVNQTKDSQKTSRFVQVTAAYAVLSDPIKRANYDKENRIGNYESFSSQQRKANATYERYSTRTRQTGPISPDHFNVGMWNAWHYGDNAVAVSNITQTRSWRDSKGDNKHQKFYDKKKTRDPESVRKMVQELGEVKSAAKEKSSDTSHECVVS